MTIANQLTLLRILLVPALLVVFYVGFPGSNFLAAGLFVLCAVTDILDGALARKRGEVSDFGALADPIADKLLVASALIMLVDTGDAPAWAVIVILARELIISGLRLIALKNGSVVSAAVSGKVKTVLQDIAITALLLRLPWSLGPVGIDEILLYVAVVATLYSAVDFWRKNKANLHA